MRNGKHSMQTVETAKEVFGVTRKIEGEIKVSSPLIRELEKRLRHIGGALYLERGQVALVSNESKVELIRLSQQTDISTDHFNSQVHSQGTETDL